MRLFLPVLLLLPIIALAAGHAAPPLPEPGAVYVQRDPAAIAMHPRPGDNARFRRQLNATIQANPRNSAALIHRAYLFHASGDIEEGDRDFERVLTLPDDIDGDNDVGPIGRQRVEQQLLVGRDLHAADDAGRVVIDNADGQKPGVQVDAAVESMLLGVDATHDHGLLGRA